MRWLLVPCLGLLAGGCLGDEPVGARRSAIYHGELARGYEGTVRLIRLGEVFGFSSCSATVVAPRVVLTARHCIEDSDAVDLAVETGREGELGQFGVAEVRTTDGQLENENDFAVLLMADRVEAPSVPFAHSFDPVEEAPIKLVGYGRTQDALLNIGIKHEGDAIIDSWDSHYLITRGDENGCYGDSGGTGLDADGTLVGVITHILYGPFPDDECEGGRTGLNRVDDHADMVDQAIADATVCEDSEICGDAVDDDCDGALDDGCLGDGEACTDAAQCQSGDCRALAGGSLCTEACTPGSFVDDCPPPTECQRLGDGSGACLEEPVDEPEPDAGAGVDAAAGGGDAGGGDDSATYGCGCRAAGSTGRMQSLAPVLLALALTVCARSGSRSRAAACRRRRDAARSSPARSPGSPTCRRA